MERVWVGMKAKVGKGQSRCLAGSYSNRGTLWAGSAAKFAAADAKRQLFQFVAEKLEVSAKDLEAKNHRIYVKGSPDRGVDFKDAVIACFVDKESKNFHCNARMGSRELKEFCKVDKEGYSQLKSFTN